MPTGAFPEMDVSGIYSISPNLQPSVSQTFDTWGIGFFSFSINLEAHSIHTLDDICFLN